jgi:hypothetical protein
MSRAKIFFVILPLVVLIQEVSASDYLFTYPAPVARHKKKNSRFVFSLPDKHTSNANDSENITDMKIGILYKAESLEGKIDKEALAYHSIDACQIDEVKIDEIFHHTEGTDNFDLLIYDSRLFDQRKKAERYNNIPKYLGIHFIRMKILMDQLRQECRILRVY